VDLGLAGKAVLVTGGSDGLGAATARRLAEEGARVAICGRDPDRLRSAARQIEEAGGEVLPLQADVSQLADLEGFVEQAALRWGRLDGLVNNAGTAAAAPFESVTDEAWEADLRLKLLAAVRASRLAAPRLREAGGGSILNVLSHAAKTPGAGSMPSSVSRASGLALTKALSKELGPDGIRVNALLVGLIESGQWSRRARDQGITEEELYSRLGSAIPLGRVGRAAEFADVAAFLLSGRSSYVTGAAINIDGGLSEVV
jgi:NAD(P)-dependent dehydrogenase (short-subunit alcohol dehydrogenase family)